MTQEIKPIILEDGSKLIPLDQEEKESLEQEIVTVLKKYDATYVPVIREYKGLSEKITKAEIDIYKIVKTEVISEEDDEEKGKEVKA